MKKTYILIMTVALGISGACGGAGSKTVKRKMPEFKKATIAYEKGRAGYTDREAGIVDAPLTRPVHQRFWQNDRKKTMAIISAEFKKSWPELEINVSRQIGKNGIFSDAARDKSEIVAIFRTIPDFIRDEKGQCTGSVTADIRFYDPVTRELLGNGNSQTVVTENMGKCRSTDLARGNLIRFIIADYYRNLGKEFRTQVINRIKPDRPWKSVP